jgi:beta-galactosidase
MLKKTLSKLLAVALFAVAGTALAANAPLPPEIENPEILSVNKEPSHATLMPYATVEQAVAGKRLESPFCRVLNGRWKFNWVPEPSQRPVDFWKPDYDVSGWKTIPVPSNWQLQGYGTPYYRNLGYTALICPRTGRGGGSS